MDSTAQPEGGGGAMEDIPSLWLEYGNQKLLKMHALVIPMQLLTVKYTTLYSAEKSTAHRLGRDRLFLS